MNDGRSEPFRVPVGNAEPSADPNGSPPGPPDGGAAGPTRSDAAAAYAKAESAAAAAVDGEDASAVGPVPTAGDPADPAGPGPAPSGAGAPTAADASPSDPVLEPERFAAQLEELSAKAQKADEYLTLAQRTQADFENYRKRAARDAGIAQERGIAKLARELLPAIDNLDRAVKAAATWGATAPGTTAATAPATAAAAEAAGEDTAAAHEAQLSSGLKLVHAEVLAALARVGIETFSPAGEVFDPQYHEAVAQHTFEGTASGTVVEVYQQGYRLGETVLRPARVLVAA